VDERNELLKKIKSDYYDGLVKELLKVKAYPLSEVIYLEKQKEKMERQINDVLIGLEIYGPQKKIDEYRELFNEITMENGKYEVNRYVCEQIGHSLMAFNSEEDKANRLDMAGTLQTLIRNKEITMSSKLFDSLVFVFTESQGWARINDMLVNSTPENCDPSTKSINYLKKNIIYCFEPVMRGQMRDNIEAFETRFFSTQAMADRNRKGRRDSEPREPRQQR